MADNLPISYQQILDVTLLPLQAILSLFSRTLNLLNLSESLFLLPPFAVERS